jgi:AcrR family transcriptional regulator
MDRTAHPAHIRTRTGTALRRRGLARVRKILASAEKVFVSQGYQSFSLRNVAVETGISLGNLTYYFKSKEDLLRSMIDGILADYESGLNAILKEFPDDPEARLKGYMQYLLADSRHPKRHQFFYHFWAISTHDRFVAGCRRRAYEAFRDQVEGLCRAVNPALSKKAVTQRTYLLMALIEGMHVLFGNRKTPDGNLDKIAHELCRQTMVIVTSSE